MASTISAQTSGAGGISMTGDASGILNLNSNGTNVVAVTSTGVAVTGTLAASGAVTLTSTLGVTGAITGSSTVAGSAGILYPLTSGTAVASTSGTSIDFTSIPSWVKRITVMLSSVSTSSTSFWQIQLGAGSVTTSGYVGATTYVVNATTSTSNATSGFIINNSAANTGAWSSQLILSLSGSNKWVASSVCAQDVSARLCTGAGSITTAGTLDRIRLTTVNGTDTFTAGSVNILYE